MEGAHCASEQAPTSPPPSSARACSSRRCGGWRPLRRPGPRGGGAGPPAARPAPAAAARAPLARGGRRRRAPARRGGACLGGALGRPGSPRRPALLRRLRASAGVPGRGDAPATAPTRRPPRCASSCTWRISRAPEQAGRRTMGGRPGLLAAPRRAAAARPAAASRGACGAARAQPPPWLPSCCCGGGGGARGSGDPSEPPGPPGRLRGPPSWTTALCARAWTLSWRRSCAARRRRWQPGGRRCVRACACGVCVCGRRT